MINLVLQTLPAGFSGAVDAALQPALDTPADFLSRISGAKMLYAAVILVMTFVVVRLSNTLLMSLGGRAVRARLFFSILAPIVRFVLWLVGGYIVLTIFAPSQNALLAVVASVGLALGLGAQDLIKNLIGGIVILTDRPYQLGDRVRIGEAYGEIDHIGLRSTKLTTPENTRVTIPNSDVLTGMAWNANSGVPDCQVVTDLFLPHDTDPATALEIGYEAAYSSPFVLLSKPVLVLLQDRFSEVPFLQIRVKAYVYDHRMEGPFQSDIVVRAKTEFIRRGLLHPA